MQLGPAAPPRSPRGIDALFGVGAALVVVAYGIASAHDWAMGDPQPSEVLWMALVVVGASAFVAAGFRVLRTSSAVVVARLAFLCGAAPVGLLMVARLVAHAINRSTGDDEVGGQTWTDLVSAIRDASAYDRPWLVGELVTIALAWALLLQLPSIRTSARQRLIVHAGGSATAVAVVDLAFFSATPGLVWPTAIATAVVAAAAAIVSLLAWQHHLDLTPPLLWMERVAIPGLLVGAAVIGVSRTVAGESVLDRDGALTNGWGNVFAVMAFLLLACPASALVVLLHDHVAVGGRWGFSRLLAARESPADLRDVLRRLLDDDALDLVFLPSHGRRAYGIDGRPVDLSSVPPTRLRRFGTLDDWPAAVVLSDAARGDDEQVAAVLGVASIAIERVQLQARLLSEAELIDANRRLVVAMDEARRQIERDLHDGAQAQLVVVQAAVNQLLVRAEDPDRRAELDRLARYVEAVVRSIRELSRGIVPQSLATGGIAAAVEQLAEQLPAVVSCDVSPTRYGRVISTTAYLVVSECLTNTTRHSGATAATVRVYEDDGALVVSVADSGRGGARSDEGSGLSGLADRIAALGGVLTVDSPSGAGTTVTARIPIHDDDRIVDLTMDASQMPIVPESKEPHR